LIITEAYGTSTKLLAEDAVFLAKVIDHLQLARIHPSGEGDHDEPEWI